MTSRSMCFTYNNYTDEILISIKEWKCRYCIIGFEKAPTTGTPHIQGYVEWLSSKRFNTAHKLLPGGHWEAAKGTAEQNYIYCSKSGNFWEQGERKEQGKRNDLEAMANSIIENKKIELSLIEEYPTQFIRYHRGLEKLAGLYLTPRTEKPTILWRWGLTGVGKTRFVYDKHGIANVYVKDSTKWWDGYTQQKVILIDDFDGSWPYRDLLRLLDRYPYQGQIKGGYVHINSPHIYFTCEFPPDEFWKNTELAQILRRVADVAEVSEGNTKPLTQEEKNSEINGSKQ